MLKKIKIIYDGFDKKIDNIFKKIAKNLNYEFIGSGYDFTTKKRDIEFEKIIK